MTICPICNNGNLKEKKADNMVEYKGVEKNIPFVYSVCDSCGSEQAGADDMAFNKQQMTDFKLSIDNNL